MTNPYTPPTEEEFLEKLKSTGYGTRIFRCLRLCGIITVTPPIPDYPKEGWQRCWSKKYEKATVDFGRLFMEIDNYAIRRLRNFGGKSYRFLLEILQYEPNHPAKVKPPERPRCPCCNRVLPLEVKE